MINHIRTSLLNRNGDHGYGYDYPGEEFVLTTFRAKAVPTFLAGAFRLLFGSNPDRLYLNYRMRQIMSLLHSTELTEFVLRPDTRVTYWPMVDDGFLDAFTTTVDAGQLGSQGWTKAGLGVPIVGSVVSGTYQDTWYDDDSRWVVQEGLGLDIRFYWYDIPAPDLELEVRFNGYYTGNSNHNIKVQGLLAGATYWPLLPQSKDLPDNGTEDIDLVFPMHSGFIYNDSDVSVRFFLTAGGNPAHQLHIDKCTLGIPGVADIAARLFIVGEHESDDGAGITGQQWLIEVVGGSSVRVTRQTPPLTSTLESYTVTDSLTGEIALSGSSQKFRMLYPVPGDSWVVTAQAEPQSDFGATLQMAMNLIPQSGIDNLFLSPVDPIPTLKSVWDSHPLFAYKYSALLLAIAYYLDGLPAAD